MEVSLNLYVSVPKVDQVKINHAVSKQDLQDSVKANLLLVGQVTRYLVSLRNVFSRSAVRWSRLLFDKR